MTIRTAIQNSVGEGQLVGERSALITLYRVDHRINETFACGLCTIDDIRQTIAKLKAFLDFYEAILDEF